MTRKPMVLILCTGNSCRSQMAEGLVNHFCAEEWEAFSAGSQPAGIVHPLAIQAMAELAIDISANRSKPIAEFRNQPFDLVITVCANAAENCPIWLGSGRIVHIGFEDPARATGNQAEKMDLFRRVRDQIRASVLPYLGREANLLTIDD